MRERKRKTFQYETSRLLQCWGGVSEKNLQIKEIFQIPNISFMRKKCFYVLPGARNEECSNDWLM